jgi:hypothetical protein
MFEISNLKSYYKTWHKLLSNNIVVMETSYVDVLADVAPYL